MGGNPKQARRFRLGSNWQSVVRYAWSVRLIALAVLFTGLEVAMPVIGPYLPWGPGWFAAASGLVSVAALVARVMVQSSIKRSRA